MEPEYFVIGGLLSLATTLIGLGVYNNKLDNDAVLALVQRGATPIEAACAIRPTEKISGACAVLVSKK